MNIMLCYLSDDEASINALNQYWERDEDGKYVRPADPNYSAKARRQAGKAVDLDKRHACGHPAHVKSRSDARWKWFDQGKCEECLFNEAQEEEEVQNSRQELLEKLVREHMAEEARSTIDYETVPYHAIFILNAINQAMGDRLAEVGGVIKPLEHLGPVNKSWNKYYLTRIYRAGVAASIPNDGITGGFLLGDGDGLEFYAVEVFLKMYKHANHSLVDTMAIVKSRAARFDDPDDLEDMVSLWSEVARQECWQYLSIQLDQNNLPWPDAETTQSLNDVFRSSLLEYGPAKMWNSIWKCTKDAAALTTRPYYSFAKAVATLPGKIQRHIGIARAGNWHLKDYTRTQENFVSVLTLAFWEQFGITESTSVNEARVILEKHLQDSIEDSSDVLFTIQNMLALAEHCNDLPKTVLRFGRMMQSGAAAEDAATALISDLSNTTNWE